MIKENCVNAIMGVATATYSTAVNLAVSSTVSEELRLISPYFSLFLAVIASILGVSARVLMPSESKLSFPILISRYLVGIALGIVSYSFFEFYSNNRLGSVVSSFIIAFSAEIIMPTLQQKVWPAFVDLIIKLRTKP